MADKVAIDLSINASGANKSIKELKQSIKDLKNAALEAGEGSKAFVKFTNEAAKAQDELNDLNDSIRALDKGNLGQNIGRIGSTLAGGFQAAQGAMALFGGEAKEVEKALLKVQAATALAQGVQSVQDLGKAFQALNLIVRANPIAAVATAVIALGTAIYQVSKSIMEAESETAKLERTNKKLEETNKILTAQYDAEIIALTGLSSNEEKIIELKKKKILLTIQEAEANLLLQQKNKERVKEQQKEIGVWEAILVATGNGMKVLEDRAEVAKETIGKEKQALLDLQLAKANLQQLDNIEKQKEIDKEKEQAEKLKRILEERMKAQKAANKELNTFSRDAAKETAKELELTIQPIIEVTSQLTESLYNQLINGNYRFIEENQKTFSEVQNLLGALESLTERGSKSQKAFAISSATINTYLAASKALATLPPPSSFIAASAALVAGFANVRNILKTPTKSTNVPSGSGFSGSRSTGASQGVSITPLRSTTSTMIEREKVEEGQSVVRAYVVESELTSKQKGISNIVKKSKI